MESTKHVKPNNSEFVVMSVDGYKKLANIDSTGENLYWTEDIDTEIPIKLKFQTDSGKPPLIPKTLTQLYLNNAREHPDWPSLHVELSPGKWTFWTWEE